MQADLYKQLGALLKGGECRPLAELLQSNEPLKGMESMLLRTYFSSTHMEPRRHLDPYGKMIFIGDIEGLKDDYVERLLLAMARADDLMFEEANRVIAQEIYALRWGPTRVPVYDVLLLGTIMVPTRRTAILEVTQWLANEVNVPVNGRDVSGTTAIHHAISTKPTFDPEFAQILYDAGGDVRLQNRYGETAVFEAVKIFEPHRAEAMRQATGAIRWYLSHGGNFDIKDNDGSTARSVLVNKKVSFLRAGGEAGAELYRMVEKEDERRRELGEKCCTFCGIEPDNEPLLACSRCRTARYCRPPRNCQKLDWPRHKMACKKT